MNKIFPLYLCPSLSIDNISWKQLFELVKFQSVWPKIAASCLHSPWLFRTMLRHCFSAYSIDDRFLYHNFSFCCHFQNIFIGIFSGQYWMRWYRIWCVLLKTTDEYYFHLNFFSTSNAIRTVRNQHMNR